MSKPRMFLVSVAAVVALAACAPQPAGQGAPPAADAPSVIEVDEALGRLDSGDWVLQAQAMSVLARAKAVSAAPPLRAILGGGSHPWVRGRALVTLVRILGDGALDDALAAAGQQAPELRAAAMEALGLLDSPRAMPAVEAHLKDPVAAVRYEALVALARLQKEKAWDRVAQQASDADPATVRSAARALVYVGTPQARKMLVGLFEHKDEGVRLAAAQALQAVRDPDAIPVLLKRRVSDSAERVKAACERALLAYEPAALAKPLLAALNSEDASLYAAALKILAARPSPEARAGVVAILRAAQEWHKGVIEDAMDVAAGDDPRPFQDVFVPYLEHAEPSVRRRAIEILARCPDADHFGLLKARLADKATYVRAAALKALRKSTAATPAGGIVDYLGGVVGAAAPDIFEESLVLLEARLAPADLPQVLAALDPVFAGADDRRRARAAEALGPLASAEANRKVAAAQCYVTQWQVLGPFPNEERQGISAVYPPELEVDFTKTYEPYAMNYGAMFKDHGSARTIAGGNRQSLDIRPPFQDGMAGRTIATYILDLPKAKDLKLTMYASCWGEGPVGVGFRLETDVDGRKVLDRKVLAKDSFALFEAGLAEFAGKRVTLDLVVEALPGYAGEQAIIAEPRVVSADAVVADLVRMSAAATARSVMPGAASVRLAWQPAKTIHMNGEVDIREMMAIEGPGVAYVATDIESPADQKVLLAVAVDLGAKVWLNGTLLTEKPLAASGRFQVSLRKGRNRLLLKVFTEWGEWSCSVRVSDPGGRRLEAPPAGG